jgi:hypothetical protein
MAALAGGPSFADKEPVELGPPITPFVIDVDLRNLPQVGGFHPGDPIREIPIRTYVDPTAPPLGPEPEGVDPLVGKQRGVAPRSARMVNGFTTPVHNFAGQGYTSVNPPDTVGDIGPAYYIQSINSGGGANVRIFDKALPPNQITTFRMDNLGTGACASGFGDPIVLYDRQAARWLMAEFAGSGNHLCVYISITGDPVAGGWYAYDFSTASFPDYPKYGVWATDANSGDGSYIVTANDGGPGAYALNRGEMLVGGTTQFLRIGMPRLTGFGIQGPAPADPDGPLGPPDGAPAIIMRHRDTELHNGPSAAGDVLEMWEFQVDWQNTGNTTLQLVDNIDVADFDSRTCGTVFGGCFEQPGTGTTLFPIREVIMNRLQYYKHSTFETLVGNFVVDVGGDQGGVRWFELRRDTPADPWTTYQEGTYSIDSDNRWMAGTAMDQSQNIALAYSVSSSTTHPSLRYTGRTVDDAPGVMTQGENSISEGSGSNSSERWGDYAAMGLDPADDCTFWFTSLNNFSSNWRTQIASFRFDLCGCQLAPGGIVPAASLPTANTVDLSWGDADLDTVVEYVVGRSRTPGGPYDTIGVVGDSSPGSALIGAYGFTDDDVDGGVTYYYKVTARDDGVCASFGPEETAVTPFGTCSLRPLFDGLGSATGSLGPTCATQLDWTAARPECDGPVAYNIYRSTDPGFAPGPQNLLVAGEPGTSVLDVNDLTEGLAYHYVVRAVDLSNGTEDLNDVSASALAAGFLTGLNTVRYDDFFASTSIDDWTVTTGPGLHRCGEWQLKSDNQFRPTGGSGQYVSAESYICAADLTATSTTIESPSIDLAIPGLVTATLEVNIFYNHLDGDDSTIDVWDGSAWITVWSDPNSDVNQKLVLDVTAYASADFRVRFDYQNARADRWFSFDNLNLVADVFNPCSTSPAPGPGRILGVDNSGGSLQIDFNGGCGAADYHLLYGDLATAGTYVPDGAECSLGTAGDFDWTTFPSGNLYFLVVGSDGNGTEGSWGSGVFGERNGLGASGFCGTSIKETTGVCP